MRAFRQPIPAPGAARSERNRLILFSALLVVVVGALVATWTQGERLEREEEAPLPAAAELPEVVPFVPEIDADALEALVEDADAADRVVLEREAVEHLFERLAKTTPASFEALGARPLDAALVEELLARPSEHRGRAFVARGRIQSLRTSRRGFGGETETFGRLALEDGAPAYFLVREVPESTLEGDFVRVDGIFLKAFSDEDRERRGTWIEGPLLVGTRLVPSAEAFGPVTRLDPNVFREVEDDSLDHVTGIPYEPLWHLMAFARDLPPDAVDWSAAPVLDRATLAEIRSDGSAWRGMPFRVPLSKLLGAAALRAGENPARIERYTDGWIGNTQWSYPIRFEAPRVFDDPRLYDGVYDDYVYGRGFFLKSFGYETRDGAPMIAPVFVLQELAVHEPETSPVFGRILWGAAIVFVGLMVTFVVLLTRDGRRSAELQRRLVERRRARRAAAGAEKAAAPRTQSP